MKKLILFVSLLFVIIVTTQAQTDTNTTKVSTEINSVVSNFYDKTTEVISNLAKSLKVPAEHVYGVLVKQQVVKSWTWVIVDLALFLIAGILWVSWLKDKRDRDEWWGLPTFFTIVFLGFFAGSISTIVTGFVNPEYGAINEILNLLK